MFISFSSLTSKVTTPTHSQKVRLHSDCDSGISYKLRGKDALSGHRLNIATLELDISDMEIKIVFVVINAKVKLTVPSDW